MVAYWCLYGLITGFILMIALYLMTTPYPFFSDANITTSRVIRKSAGWVIAVCSLEFAIILPVMFLLQSIVPGLAFNEVNEWGSSIVQQMKVLLFMPVLSLFLLSVMQGTSKIRQWHIVACAVFPFLLLMWTIVYGIIHLPEEGMRFSVSALHVARAYWAMYVVLLLYYYSQSLHRYRCRLQEMYSSIGYRGVRWLYWLLGMNILYFAWYVFTYSSLIPTIQGVMIQHMLALVISAFVCYQVDRQEQIVWEKDEPDPAIVDLDNPALIELDKRLTKLVEQKVYLNADLSRDDLVELLRSNRTYLNKYFSAKNLTFYSFVNGLRIEYAISLMHQSHNKGTLVSLKEVALNSGFKSAEVFSRYFKNMKGCSPSMYLINNNSKQTSNQTTINKSTKSS